LQFAIGVLAVMLWHNVEIDFHSSIGC